MRSLYGVMELARACRWDSQKHTGRTAGLRRYPVQQISRFSSLRESTQLVILGVCACSVQLDGGTVGSSNTCWTDAASTAQPLTLRSGVAETELGPIAFSINLQDNNPATGGTYVGPISAIFKCSYYTPAPFVGSVDVRSQD